MSKCPTCRTCGLSPVYYRVADLLVMFGISQDTLAAWRTLPTFPREAPVPGRPRWHREEIDAWVESQLRFRRKVS